MAYKNFLGKNTYVTVDRIDYCPIDKSINFLLGIYSDTSRSRLLATKEHRLSGATKIVSLKGRVNDFPALDDTKKGDVYLVRNKLGHSEQNCKWLVAERNNLQIDTSSPDYHPALNWTCWMVGGHETFFVEEEGKYYGLSDAEKAELIQIWPIDDIRIWNNFFSKSVLNQKGVLKQCYLYLKSLPEYADAIEC
jgi:hypothetical protein